MSYEKKDNIKRRILQITITERCNLNCVYCYEHNKDLEILSIEKIKDFIISETANLDGFDEIEFDFHGGEPMLAFPQIKEIAEWIWSRKWSKPYILFATTNGTLVHGEIKEWFRKNAKRFVLGLSLDGTKKQHDINRSNSYDKIDFSFFREMWPTQGVKATVSPASIHDFAAGVKHIVELGFNYSINLAYGMNWTDDLLPIYRREMKKFVDFYLENPKLELPKLFAHIVSLVGVNAQKPLNEREKRKWCGTGSNMICIAPNGKTYPCQAFMPSSEVKEGENIQKIIDFDENENFHDPICINCILDSSCPCCYGNNYLRTGTLYERDKLLCKFRKIEAVASSYCYGKMFENPGKYPYLENMSDSEKLAIAHGIKFIQEAFVDEVMNYGETIDV